MTLQEFDSLPDLLRRKDVMTMTGVCEQKYYEMISRANGYVVTIPGYREKRVRKEFLRFLVTVESPQTATNCPEVPHH